MPRVTLKKAGETNSAKARNLPDTPAENMESGALGGVSAQPTCQAGHRGWSTHFGKQGVGRARRKVLRGQGWYLVRIHNPQVEHTIDLQGDVICQERTTEPVH